MQFSNRAPPLETLDAGQCTGSKDGSLEVAASSFRAAGSSRFFSRSLMNSSYFAVPGRGGASAGKPPSHCGTKSPIPSARLSLTVPQAPRPHESSTSARRVVSGRELIGIGGAGNGAVGEAILALQVSKSGLFESLWCYDTIHFFVGFSRRTSRFAGHRPGGCRPWSRLTSSCASDAMPRRHRTSCRAGTWLENPGYGTAGPGTRFKA